MSPKYFNFACFSFGGAIDLVQKEVGALDQHGKSQPTTHGVEQRAKSPWNSGKEIFDGNGNHSR